MLRRVVRIVKDFLFPIFCCGCGEEGVWFCKQCKRRTKVRPFVFYPVFKELIFGVLVFFPYTCTIWSKLIGNWKYHSAEDISDEWISLFNQERLFLLRYLSSFERNKTVYLVPVPLHPRRERERGFNQSKILSNILLEKLANSGIKVQVLDCLQRVRYTTQQAKLSPSAREKNLSNAFVWKQKNIIPEQVILIDDVFTTGFTARECALVLKTMGVKKVGMIVLAHG